MLDEEDSDNCGGENGMEEDGVASQCLDIEEDHMGEIEEQLTQARDALPSMLDAMEVDDDPPTFCYPSSMQDDEVYFNMQNAE